MAGVVFAHEAILRHFQFALLLLLLLLLFLQVRWQLLVSKALHLTLAPISPALVKWSLSLPYHPLWLLPRSPLWCIPRKNGQ